MSLIPRSNLSTENPVHIIGNPLDGAGAVAVDDLIAQASAVGDEIKTLDEQRDEAVRDQRDAERSRDAVDGSDEAAEAQQEALGVLSRIRDHFNDYARLRVAASILRQRIESHREQNQDPLVDRASTLFAELTCGSYTGLVVEPDENDDPAILAVGAEDQTRMSVPALSDGTADQLYLALRLAYLEQQLERREPMPLIVDDILVDFDDERAKVALRVLGELSLKTQVLFLTHHDHLRALARTAVPEGVLFEHELKDDHLPSGSALGPG